MIASDMQTLAGTQDFVAEVAACLGEPWAVYLPRGCDGEQRQGQAWLRDGQGRELALRWSPYDAEGRLAVSARIEEGLSRHVRQWEHGSAKGTFAASKDAGQIVKELRSRVLPKVDAPLAQAKASLAAHLAGHERTAAAVVQITEVLRAAGLDPSVRWELSNLDGTPEVESCAATVHYFAGDRGGDLGVRCWGAENPVSVQVTVHVGLAEALRMLEGLKA